jgi:hypothetical protein
MIATAAAAAMLAGAAFAQPGADNSSSPNALPSGAEAAPSAAPAPDAAAQPGADTVAPAAGAPVERTPAGSAESTDIVSNGPIPDTRANREKYGRPLSNAGRMTKPSGN